MSRLRRRPQIEDDLKNYDNLKNEDSLKNKDNLKNKDDLKIKDDPVTWNFFRPQLMLNRKLYQVSKTEMEFQMINIIYAALSMRALSEKTTFSCKDNFL